MTLALAENPDAMGIYNVGSGRASTWLELIEPVFSALGLQPKITFVDMPERMRSAYQYRTQATLSRLREAGCPIDEIPPLASSVCDYVQSYLLPGRHVEPDESERYAVHSGDALAVSA